MDRQLENAYESVLRRNPGEAEFHQAVREIFESVSYTHLTLPTIYSV